MRHVLIFGLVVILALAAQLDPVHIDATTPRGEAQRAADQTNNPIVAENSQPGSTAWELTKPASHHEIEGYASVTSAQAGDQVAVSVSTTAPHFSLDVYRLGWYGGKGGRLLLGVDDVPGQLYPTPSPDPETGLIACSWPAAYSLTIPSTWVSGLYLIKLTASTGYQSYIPLVIRDQRPSTFLMIHAANTDEAYNSWGGKSLYGGSSSPSGEQGFADRAVKVSFDRPFRQNYGAGQIFWWEYHMVRWLEQNGYDVSYVSDVDVHEHPDLLLDHKGILIVGHDEYWSKQMRDNLEAAVAAGVNLGVFAGNTGYWAIRYEPLGSAPDRVIVCYRYPLSPDPELSVDPSLVTSTWRSAPLNRPESDLLGAMYAGDTYQNAGFPWVVNDDSSWVFAGTGLKTGDSLPGLVGYEYDGILLAYPGPAGLVDLAASPVMDGQNKPHFANATLYTAASGARVFNASTIQWAWGLDDFNPPYSAFPATQVVSASAAQITANILTNFATVPSIPPTTVTSTSAPSPATPTSTMSPTTTPTSSATATPALTGTTTSTGTPSSTETTPSSRPESNPTATGTGTVEPTSTATAVGTVGPVPTPTQQEKEAGRSFTVIMAKVAYATARPGRAIHHASLPRITVGQTVKLLLYVTFARNPGKTPIHQGFRVLQGHRTIYFKSRRSGISILSNRPRTAAYWVYFRPQRVGTFVFAGTLYVGTAHEHKTVPFRVVARTKHGGIHNAEYACIVGKKRTRAGLSACRPGR